MPIGRRGGRPSLPADSRSKPRRQTVASGPLEGPPAAPLGNLPASIISRTFVSPSRVSSRTSFMVNSRVCHLYPLGMTGQFKTGPSVPPLRVGVAGRVGQSLNRTHQREV